MKDKPKQFRPTANPAYAEGMREIRRSNKAGIHLDKRTRRKRTRQSANDNAIIDSKEGNN